MVEFVIDKLTAMQGNKIVWAVGERIQSRLAETRLLAKESFILPNSINAITPLVGQILIEVETQQERGVMDQFYVVHNRPQTGAICTPMMQQLLPLDETWPRFPGRHKTSPG